jgi:hypothetical protein
VEPEETSIAGQRLGIEVSVATDMQATTEELLGMMFYVQSMQSGNKRRELVNWCSVGSQVVKRRFYVCYNTIIFGVCNSVRLL